LRLDGSERSASSDGVSPSPSMISGEGNALYKKRNAAEDEDKRKSAEFGFPRREDPKAQGSHGKAQIKHRAARMVFQVAAKFSKKNSRSVTVRSLPQKGASRVSEKLAHSEIQFA